MNTAGEAGLLSVVVPVLASGTEPREIFRVVECELERHGIAWECIFVVDGPQHPGLAALRRLAEQEPQKLSVVVLSKPQGEAAALTAGFDRARGESVMTLSSHLQVEPVALGRVLREHQESGVDMVVGWRHPRKDGLLPRLQSTAYHWMVRALTATGFHDISCGLRVMKLRVARDLDLYGDFYRFIPVLAHSRGFTVREVAVEQSSEDRPRGLYGPAAYSRRFLDSLSLFFLVRFTQRPLRFFGTIGIGLLLPGLLVTLYLGLYRLLGFGGIAFRPLLLLGLVLLVVGVQSISIGLLGELIIFGHRRRASSYRVAEVVGVEAEPAGGETGRAAVTPGHPLT